MVEKTSLTERAYRQVHRDILLCRLPPGEKISIKDVASRLSVSAGAVREALARLSSEGFVQSDDSRGFRATPLTLPDFLDLVAVRTDIETQCLRRAIVRGDIRWEAGVVSAAHRLSRTAERMGGTINPDYAEAHAAFHAALVSACDSRWLLQIREWLYAQSERYRNLSHAKYVGAPRDLNQEHGELSDAAVRRDAGQAVALLTEHLRRTAETIDKSMFPVGEASGADSHSPLGPLPSC